MVNGTTSLMECPSWVDIVEKVLLIDVTNKFNNTIRLMPAASVLPPTDFSAAFAFKRLDTTCRTETHIDIDHLKIMKSNITKHPTYHFLQYGYHFLVR